MKNSHLAIPNGTIFAIGGGEIGRPGFNIETQSLDETVLQIVNKKDPQVLFVGTAMNDDSLYETTFNHYYGNLLGCQVRHLKVSGLDELPNGADKLILNSDLIYVGAGSTGSILDKWKALGIDAYFGRYLKRGGVLGGLSAGGVCWFKNIVSGGAGEPIKIIPGLGLLPLTVCPHFSSSSGRQEQVYDFVRSSGDPVLAIDDRAGIFFSKGKVFCKSEHNDFNVYIVTLLVKRIEIRSLTKNYIYHNVDSLFD